MVFGEKGIHISFEVDGRYIFYEAMQENAFIYCLIVDSYLPVRAKDVELFDSYIGVKLEALYSQ